jgi:clan AA aspartic protease (TIGR02281 family)
MSTNGFSPGFDGACVGWRKAMVVAGCGLLLVPALRAVDGAPEFVSDIYPIYIVAKDAGGSSLDVVGPHQKVKVVRRDGDSLVLEAHGHKDKFSASRFSFSEEMIGYWVGEAVRKYPDLGVNGSAFSDAFHAEYTRIMNDRAYRLRHGPVLLVLPDNWPMELAEKIAAARKAAPIANPGPLAFLFPATNDPSAAVPMVKEGGVLKLPVKVNDAIQLKFIVDSGATDVQIPEDVFLTLTRMDTVQKQDMLPPATYTIANGKQVTRPRFILRSLRVGNTNLTDVKAMVGETKSDLLLGQSFLSRFKEWKIDNQNATILLEK